SADGQGFLGWLQIGSSAAGSAFTAFFIFRFVFERWLWRWRVFQGRLVVIPDLSGVWSGDLHSISYDDHFHNVVEIEHKFDRVVYSSKRQGNDGKSVSSEVTISCDVRRDAVSDQVELIVVYRNKPGPKDTMDTHGQPHEGCAVLELRNEKLPQKK